MTRDDTTTCPRTLARLVAGVALWGVPLLPLACGQAVPPGTSPGPAPDATPIVTGGPTRTPAANTWTAAPPPVAQKPASIGPPPTAVPTDLDALDIASFTGGADGYCAALATRKGAAKAEVHVVRLSTGEVAGTVHPKGGCNHFSVRPDGRLIAFANLNSFSRLKEVEVRSVQDDKPVGTFKPHVVAEESRSDFIGVRFVSADRLLTATASGGFAVWTAGDQKQVYAVPGKLAVPKQDDPHDLYRRFAVSQDGKRVAVFDGEGFGVYETEAGKPLGNTGPIPDASRAVGAAFQADGTRLAALVRFGTEAQASGAGVVWDVATGMQLARFPYPRTYGLEYNTIQWFGPDHVIVRDGGGNVGGVWSAATGEQAGSIITRFAPGGPDDQ